MISPGLALSSSFLTFRPAASPTHPSPPPSLRLHAPPPLSASFSPPASASSSAVAIAAPDHATTSFYDVLDLHAWEIKAAYRLLARAIHPDASPHPAASAEDFIRVHAAYCTLSYPNKRADYDRRLLLSAVASAREIKAAYHRLPRAVHPNASPHPAASAEDFIRVHAAYCTLSDLDKHADYDRRCSSSLSDAAYFLMECCIFRTVRVGAPTRTSDC